MVNDEALRQGNIITVERIKMPVLIVSKDFFNRTGEIVGCPVFTEGKPGPLHIYIRTDQCEGYVQCEKLALLDMNVRVYKKVDRISSAEIMNITDAVQGIFDYI